MNIAGTLPSLSASQMAEIDRIMLQDFGVGSLQLMELAGHAVASFAREHQLDGLAHDKRIVVLAGTGGNGGDGMVAARLLTAWGANVSVILTRPVEDHAGIALHQLGILERWGIPLIDGSRGVPASIPEDTSLIIDGLLGFSLEGDPHGTAAELIEVANAAAAPILAIDLPSGLNATTGEIGAPCIRAAATLTLALPKSGLGVDDIRAVTGDLWLADIGVPPAAYARIGVPLSALIFTSQPFLRLSTGPTR
ncbi:MAG: NAD(P)H-hydrate epimerase / ADP-dependent (S)-NAD(P)H-hydrate dehydratase [uncultured Thermomicrobiales bacterium]|uniref:NAD(P)H-hydrate epimerase n=2 Tax=uncultured Thermomicrobiales bacterium TaxID=1645740 RepID=A0A6J4VHZ6_9BACT|nr:MAG: NAD(P)H-hydrate epimerase / ADP-dependent (S)-NAD(P)H-hydrate dehydratase [uncultured Thermomicrobiales bacterium]